MRQLRNGVSDQKAKDYTLTNQRYMCRSGLAYVKGFESFRLSGTVRSMSAAMISVGV
jgi:hypothetical protein